MLQMLSSDWSIRHEDDARLELAEEDGSSLVISDLSEADSGQYECRSG